MVKTCGFLAGAAVLCLSLTARAEQPADAKAILDDGIKALGGSKKLSKLPCTTFRSEGYLLLGDLRVDSKSTWSVQYPDKYRYDGKIKINDNSNSLLAIGNGDKGWSKADDDPTRDIEEETYRILQQDTRALHLAHRLVPLTEKGFTLSVLGELKIDNRPALGIKIAEKGQPDLDLYFDKETHLPIKASFRCKETKDGEPVPHTFTFGDYKEADGLKHFTKIKMFRDEKQILEMNLSEVKRVEKVEGNPFEKP